jgi:hypothetical protein
MFGAVIMKSIVGHKAESQNSTRKLAAVEQQSAPPTERNIESLSIALGGVVKFKE